MHREDLVRPQLARGDERAFDIEALFIHGAQLRGQDIAALEINQRGWAAGAELGRGARDLHIARGHDGHGARGTDEPPARVRAAIGLQKTVQRAVLKLQRVQLAEGHGFEIPGHAEVDAAQLREREAERFRRKTGLQRELRRLDALEAPLQPHAVWIRNRGGDRRGRRSWRGRGLMRGEELFPAMRALRLRASTDGEFLLGRAHDRA